jgi:hypothetical protein
MNGEKNPRTQGTYLQGTEGKREALEGEEWPERWTENQERAGPWELQEERGEGRGRSALIWGDVSPMRL